MDVYEQLQKLLHKHIAGAPKSRAFDEILKILFSPEQAKVAIGMVFVPRNVEEIAKASQVKASEVAGLCEDMAKKGIIFSRKKHGEMGYSLLPTVPGLFEFPFMKGETSPVLDRLGKLWAKYHTEEFGQEFSSSKTPFARVIPVFKAIDAQNQVMPYEEILPMLEKNNDFALAHCACRMSLGHDACDAPTETCLMFDGVARFLIERGLAKRTTREKIKDLLLRAEEAGLVHTTSNAADRLTFVCNCCPCCCTILRGLTELKNPNAFAKSRWLAKVNSDACTGCGVCENERCPMDAIHMEDDVAIVDREACIGCGLCASTCEPGAITMTPRPGCEAPPASIQEMGLAIATEKDRLQEFINMGHLQKSW